MRLSAVAVLMILTTVFLSGCGKDPNQMASLDDHQSNFYGRNGVMSGARGAMSGTMSNATQADVPVMGVSSSDLPAPSGNAAPAMAASSAMPSTHVPFQHASATWPPTNAQAGVNTSPAMAAAPSVTSATATAWQWPVRGKVIERFGSQGNGTSNEGITIAAAEGTPIRAAQGGEVAFVGQDTKNYGNIVILRHADGEMSSYSHAREIIVAKGAHVAQGSVLGYVGTSGNVKTPVLHFAVREGNHGVDPLSKLSQNVASN